MASGRIVSLRRLQLHALAYNLGNFLRTLALPEAVERWSLTTMRERLIKIGANYRAPWALSRFSAGGDRHLKSTVRRCTTANRRPAAKTSADLNRGVTRIPVVAFQSSFGQDGRWNESQMGNLR
jgi:hypothetical protein